MPIMSPFKPKGNGHEVLKGRDHRLAAMEKLNARANQTVVETAKRKGRSDKLNTTVTPSIAPPPVNVGWGSLDPSIPKKVSISRRTLNPSSREGPIDATLRELDEIDQMSEGFSEIDEDEDIEVYEMEGSLADLTPALTQQRSGRNSRPNFDRRRSSSCPPNKHRNAAITSPVPMSPSRRSHSPIHTWSQEDSREELEAPTPIQDFSTTLQPPVPPKAKSTPKTLSLPVSRYSNGSKPAERRQNTAAMRKFASRAERDTIRSSAASVETVYIALDQEPNTSTSPLLSVKTPLQPKPDQEMSREERHQANKILYYQMKAERHNLRVLLDASNRRADIMMQTLSAEERKCRELENKTHELQATLDTLNARRLWQQQDDDESSTYSSKRTSELLPDEETIADTEQVTAELQNLRKNLDQSRTTVRKMKSFTQEARELQRQALPTVSKLQTSEHELKKTMLQPVPADPKQLAAGESSLFTAHDLDARLRDLIKPTPVRPTVMMTESLDTPTSAKTPTKDEEQSTPVHAPEPEEPPVEFHELDAIETQTTTLDHHRIASMKEAFEVSQVELVSHTPELSPPNSRPSSGTDSNSSSAPSPPPKSIRRLTQRSVSQSNVHPALREPKTDKESAQLVMAPLMEGEDVATAA